MIFVSRLLQEKCREQHQDLYFAFLDLTKAFDAVNRNLLLSVLSKAGCPPRFVSILKEFHSGMSARVSFGGLLSDPFEVKDSKLDWNRAVCLVIYFAINYKPARDCLSLYNSAGLLFKVSEEIATEITKKCDRRQPHCRLKPSPRGTPANIRIYSYLIFLETGIVGLHFAAHSLCLSSFNFFLAGFVKRFFRKSAF